MNQNQEFPRCLVLITLTGIALVSTLPVPPAHAQAPSELFAIAGARRMPPEADPKVRYLDSLKRVIGHQLQDAIRTEQKEKDTLQKQLDSVEAERKVALTNAEQQEETRKVEKKSVQWLPYFSSSVRLTGEGNLQERLQAAGRLLYEVPFHGSVATHLAVIGSISP